jgi:hypothetical protein
MQRSVFAGLPILLLFAGSMRAQQPIETAYFPLKVGSQWTYRAGKDQVVVQVDKQVTLEFKRDDKADKSEKAVGYQLKITSGQGDVTEQVAVLDDGVYRFSTAGKTIKPPLRFLKLGKGSPEWTVDCKTEEGKPITGKFVLGTDMVRLTINGKPLELKTYTATCKDLQVDDKHMEITYWYAENFGMVKQHIKIGKQEITRELEQFKPAP